MPTTPFDPRKELNKIHLSPTHLAIYNSLLLKVWWRYPGNWFKNFTSGHIFSLGMTMVAWRETDFSALNYLYSRVYLSLFMQWGSALRKSRPATLINAGGRSDTGQSARPHIVPDTRQLLYSVPLAVCVHDLCV